MEQEEKSKYTSWAEEVLHGCPTPTALRWFTAGFRSALREFGVWRDGKQLIGCLDVPITRVIQDLIEASDKRLEDFKQKEAYYEVSSPKE